jgi:hypothetical protein
LGSAEHDAQQGRKTLVAMPLSIDCHWKGKNKYTNDNYDMLPQTSQTNVQKRRQETIAT